MIAEIGEQRPLSCSRKMPVRSQEMSWFPWFDWNLTTCLSWALQSYSLSWALHLDQTIIWRPWERPPERSLPSILFVVQHQPTEIENISQKNPTERRMSVDNAALFNIALSVILRFIFCAEETSAPAVTGRWEPKEGLERAFCNY